MVDVFFDGVWQFVVFLNSGQSCREHGGKGQVEIACRIRRTEFNPCGLFFSWLILRDPDVGRPVSLPPGDVDRGLIALDQTLVRVDPLIQHWGNFSSMGHHEKKKIKIDEIFTKIPSPFAFNLVLQGYTDVLKMEDRLEFLRRMHQMVKAKISLKK